MKKCNGCDLDITEFNFVMIKDIMWNEISEHKDDILCPGCMEERLKRRIMIADFKSEDIPCNIDYMFDEREDLARELYSTSFIEIWKIHTWLLSNSFDLIKGIVPYKEIDLKQNLDMYYAKKIADYNLSLGIRSYSDNNINLTCEIYHYIESIQFRSSDFLRFKDHYNDIFQKEIRDEKIDKLLNNYN